MDGLTIAEAAQTTGWSARMLRYIESLGLVEPSRSGGGFRLYGPEQLQRLRTLRELLDARGLELGDVGLALRLRREPDVRRAVEAWLDSTPARPADVPADDWLRWEQDKHQMLLARTGPPAPVRGEGTAAAPAAHTEPGHGPVKESA